MGKVGRGRLTPLLVTLLLVLSTIIVLVPLPTLAANPTVGSKISYYRNLEGLHGDTTTDISSWALVCGEVIEMKVMDNSLNASETYYLKVWNGTHWIKLATQKSDEYGNLDISFHVPGWGQLRHNPVLENGTGLNNSSGNWSISLFDKHGTQLYQRAHPFNVTIHIAYPYMVKFKHKGDFIDHLIYNTSYYPQDFSICVYNWTSSGWQLAKSPHKFDITLYYPNATTVSAWESSSVTPSAGSTKSAWQTTGITTGCWNVGLSSTDTRWNDGSSLENYFWVNVTDANHPSYPATWIPLPVKLNVTVTTPSSAVWGDDVAISGYVVDGQGNGINNYPMRIYVPVNGGYTYYAVSTQFNGYFSCSLSTGLGENWSAGNWYVGTYVSGSQRISTPSYPYIDNFIPYADFTLQSKDEIKVGVESPSTIVSGFTQQFNISVYNSSWMYDSSSDYSIANNTHIHITGLKGWYNNKVYDRDDIVEITDYTKEVSNNRKYVYYVFNYTFNETGTARVLVSWPGNLTSITDHENGTYQPPNQSPFYSERYDNRDLLANATGSTSFQVVSPGDMTIILRNITGKEGVSIDTTDCWRNSSGYYFDIYVYGSSENELKDATIHITGCGLDLLRKENESATTKNYIERVGKGHYKVHISPKTGGTLTITATNSTDDLTATKDVSIKGLTGSVTTSAGDDKEINANTPEEIIVTVNNGQYANVHLSYFSKDWNTHNCDINETTGDGTEGNGLNGEFRFTPDKDDIKNVGYLVVVAKAGGLCMYDIIEITPINDLTVNVTLPDINNRTLTVGVEQTVTVVVKDPDGNPVTEDSPTVVGRLVDDEHDEDNPLQTIDFSGGGDGTFEATFIPYFKGQLIITATNDTGGTEHKGNTTLDVDYATVTYSPEGVTAGIGLKNVTINVTAVDANGNPLSGEKLYLNIIGNSSTPTFDDREVSLDEDGKGKFKLVNVGDNKTRVNATLLEFYNSTHKGNLTNGVLYIDYPRFQVDPDTIYIGQSNMVTITAYDYNGDPIPGINLTLVSSSKGILEAQPDPVQTDSNGQVTMSVQPLASGYLNVTIARNIHYENGQLNWTNAVVTDTVITVTSLKPLKISVSETSLIEGDTLTVTVTSGGSPVSGANVEFAGVTEQTDANGQVTFTVPDPGVEFRTYTITAEKYGYITAEKSITVLKLYNITILGPSKPPVAGETFTVTILAKGAPLAGAKVTVSYDGKTEHYTSDGEGKVTLTAPDVTKDTTYTITATFPEAANYKESTLTITIKAGGGGIPGFELLAFIAALGAAFILIRRRR